MEFMSFHPSKLCNGLVSFSGLCTREQLQELLFKTSHPSCSPAWGHKHLWALLCRISPGWNVGCLWSWRGDQLPGQSSRPSGRGERGLQKAWEKDTCTVLLLRTPTLISGIKACLWRDPCPFCECRVETGDFVLHKVKAQGSMIQSGFFFFFPVRFQMKFISCGWKGDTLDFTQLPKRRWTQSDSSDAFFFWPLFILLHLFI